MALYHWANHSGRMNDWVPQSGVGYSITTRLTSSVFNEPKPQRIPQPPNRAWGRKGYTLPPARCMPPSLCILCGSERGDRPERQKKGSCLSTIISSKNSVSSPRSVPPAVQGSALNRTHPATRSTTLSPSPMEPSTVITFSPPSCQQTKPCTNKFGRRSAKGAVVSLHGWVSATLYRSRKANAPGCVPIAVSPSPRQITGRSIVGQLVPKRARTNSKRH